MLLLKKNKHLQKYLASVQGAGQMVGFAPTMGALHEGHVSLIRKANEETDCSVCSIFVNPKQFNETTDLENYPRTPGKDIGLLASANCNVLFMPSVAEIYPPGLSLNHSLDFGYLEKPMEGQHRPGHFKGVAQVMKRILKIVQPDRLYMGQKDFQQFAIVQNMLEQLQSPTQIVLCPIVREESGLAMSSRNLLLSPKQRERASLIYKILLETKQRIHSHPPAYLQEEAISRLNEEPDFRAEYFEIVDGKTLKPVKDLGKVDFVLACVAVRVGSVRLIDNMILKP